MSSTTQNGSGNNNIGSSNTQNENTQKYNNPSSNSYGAEFEAEAASDIKKSGSEDIKTEIIIEKSQKEEDKKDPSYTTKYFQALINFLFTQTLYRKVSSSHSSKINDPQNSDSSSIRRFPEGGKADNECITKHLHFSGGSLPQDFLKKLQIDEIKSAVQSNGEGHV